jgi:uncharacterized protein (DUF1810 family)
MNDPFDLERFVAAQDITFDRAAAELRQGKKVTHWMWFIFPQISGLGQSPTSRKYAVTSLDEARAYLSHPVLGPRLLECAAILTRRSDRTATQVFGSIDAQKLRSSMTLFARAAPEEPLFRQVLDHYFDGQEDEATVTRL